jgi:hypothetical protein
MTWHTPANQGAVGDDMTVGCRCCHARRWNGRRLTISLCTSRSRLLKLPQLGRAITKYIEKEERMKCPWLHEPEGRSVGTQGKGWSVGADERWSVGGEKGWAHVGFVWFGHIPTIPLLPVQERRRISDARMNQWNAEGWWRKTRTTSHGKFKI